jgi:hypothetical protein
MLAQIWFLVNGLFVLLVIVFLFINRAYREALREGAPGIAAKLKVWCFLAGLAAVVSFLAMASLFLLNMRING